MMDEKVLTEFHEHTGMCEDPGIYLKFEHLQMAKPQMPAFGSIISIEVAMELVSGLAAALEEYERWEDAQTAE